MRRRARADRRQAARAARSAPASGARCRCSPSITATTCARCCGRRPRPRSATASSRRSSAKRWRRSPTRPRRCCSTPSSGRRRCIASGAMPGDRGLIVALERTGYGGRSARPGEPRPRRLGPSPRSGAWARARRSCSSTTIPAASTARQDRGARPRRSPEECAREDLLLVLEPLVYNPDPGAGPLVARRPAARDSRDGATARRPRRGRPQGGVSGRRRERTGVARRVPGALRREPGAVDPPLRRGRLRDLPAPDRARLPRRSVGRRRGTRGLERGRAARGARNAPPSCAGKRAGGWPLSPRCCAERARPWSALYSAPEIDRAVVLTLLRVAERGMIEPDEPRGPLRDAEPRARPDAEVPGFRPGDRGAGAVGACRGGWKGRQRRPRPFGARGRGAAAWVRSEARAAGSSPTWPQPRVSPRPGHGARSRRAAA